MVLSNSNSEPAKICALRWRRRSSNQATNSWKCAPSGSLWKRPSLSSPGRMPQGMENALYEAAMRNIWIIAKREFNHYFISPIAYVVAFMILLTVGIMFSLNVLYFIQNAFQAFGQAPDA